jgi:Tfp pilus assembly protein PilF
LSQILDALNRRRRASRRDLPEGPTAQGDAVLATLGYTPSGRRGRPAGLIVAAGIVALAAWLVWGVMQGGGSAPAVASAPPGVTPYPATTDVVDARPVEPPPVEPAPSAPAATIEVRQPRGSRLAVVAPPGPQRPPDPVPAAQKPPPDAAADLMTQALYHHRAGDFESALVAYRTLIEQNQLNAAAHNNLGLLYQQKDLLDDAARSFQRAIIIDARYGLAHNNYGVTLLRQGRPEEAAVQFRTVLSLEPRNVDALVNLALAEKAAGRGEQARSTLLRALGASPRHAMAHYNLAVLHDDTGEHARALEHYRAFLEHAGADHADRTAGVRARVEALANR